MVQTSMFYRAARARHHWADLRPAATHTVAQQMDWNGGDPFVAGVGVWSNCPMQAVTTNLSTSGVILSE